MGWRLGSHGMAMGLQLKGGAMATKRSNRDDCPLEVEASWYWHTMCAKCTGRAQRSRGSKATREVGRAGGNSLKIAGAPLLVCNDSICFVQRGPAELLPVPIATAAHHGGGDSDTALMSVPPRVAEGAVHLMSSNTHRRAEVDGYELERESGSSEGLLKEHIFQPTNWMPRRHS